MKPLRSSVEPGQWVIHTGEAGMCFLRCASKVAGSVHYDKPGKKHPGIVKFDSIIFVGNEGQCKAVYAKLRASETKFADDRRQAGDQHQERVERILSEARAKL